MQAKDVMTAHVITVTDDSTVQDVASVMLNRGISAVPVVDAAGKLVGIVSEGDLMRRAEAGTGRQRSWWLALIAEASILADEYVKEHSRKIADVMTRKVITATPHTPLAAIATLFEKNRIKRVPIVDDGKLVGIVSRANLLQALTAPPKHIEKAVGIEDSAIRAHILARLKAEPWSPSWLNVSVEQGVVDLWGAAESEAQKKAARVAAELTPGAVAVHDNIVISRPVAEY